jgi:hypothetical protein
MEFIIFISINLIAGWSHSELDLESADSKLYFHIIFMILIIS